MPVLTSKFASRLQEASQFYEADFHAQNPAIIGLISMLTGYIDIEDIKKTYRELFFRGTQILGGNPKV